MKRKYLYYAGVLRGRGRTARLPAAPLDSLLAVAGTVTSGGQSVTINDNVLSPDFGLPIITS